MKESENVLINKKKEKQWNSALGITYALLCATFSVMNGFFVKKVTSIKPIEMLFWRTTVQIILIWPVCMYRQYAGAANSDIFGPRSLQPHFVKWLLIRGCVGFTACALLFEAYGRLPIGDATALSSNIVWTSLIGFVVLREKIHWVDIGAIPINIVGVVLLAQPSFLFNASSVNYTREMQLGLAAALTAAFGIASSSIVLRHIAKSVHFTVLSFWFSLISMLSSGIYLSVTGGFNMPCRVSSKLQSSETTIKIN